MQLRNSYLAVIAVSLQWTPAFAADYEVTYSGTWRDSDDVVVGWDWSLPSTAMPAPESGIFNLNSRVPDRFPGNHLKQVNVAWSSLEPTEGNYDLRPIIKELDDPAYDGIMLNVRGMVVSIVDASGNPASESGVTAPEWLSATAPKTQEGLKNGFQITNMNLYDKRVKAKLIGLIQEIGRSTIPGNPRLKAQIIHGVSSSRGEEWTGKQAANSEAIAAMEEIIAAWTEAYGPYSKKLAWLKENPTRLFNASVVRGGTGIRGGAIEKWLRGQYTPGVSSETGQLLDARGYLSVDESFAPIAEKRHFQDQNEAYRSGSFIPKEKWPQNYRMANLRMLQMRRNIAWTEKDSVINPSMLNWLSLELGHTARTSPDAWVVLMRTWARLGSENREINNLERWLHQRDMQGATTPRQKVEHGFNVAGNLLLPESLWNMDLARSGPEIGIAVNDKFLSGGPHKVAIKVTYFDSENELWSLVYRSSQASTATRSVKGTATGKVKTATFMLDDFVAPESALSSDFKLESNGGNTPFMFVRLIKLEVSSDPDVRPAPPKDLLIVN